ncbi:helix-turn-helix domain-containing protein [Listeria ilorinensis]|uniref:helix-turn-helix domain-containing protein n=1 Tax=Listeria ilorinensis TaxID=2867439 RepID=UPI001EF6DDFB|nr:helix-turn-helix transcriptional regulator [Listeria ilorinensis]
MTTFDRVKKLAGKQKISIVELEEKLGFGRNSLYSWKKKTPNGESLQKVADFFNVSTDYLLGRTDNPAPPSDDEASFQAFANDPELSHWYRTLPESDEEDLQELRDLWEYLQSKKKKK